MKRRVNVKKLLKALSVGGLLYEVKKYLPYSRQPRPHTLFKKNVGLEITQQVEREIIPDQISKKLSQQK